MMTIGTDTDYSLFRRERRQPSGNDNGVRKKGREV